MKIVPDNLLEVAMYGMRRRIKASMYVAQNIAVTGSYVLHCIVLIPRFPRRWHESHWHRISKCRYKAAGLGRMID